MARSSQWRRSCPESLILRIEQALDAKIYLLRETGPTGFLLKEEEADRCYKVLLGDPHTCTCSNFKKERELCIHLLWVLLRKFRVPKESEVVYQLGLVEREINEVVFGAVLKKDKKKILPAKLDDNLKVQGRKLVEDDDICPICHVELSNSRRKEDLTYCRLGCGNNIHISCMKVWAEHQRSTGESIIKCPLCRSDFGPYKVLIQEYLKSKNKLKKEKSSDVHIGIKCRQCGVLPIQGKCFRCEICSDYFLCHLCFCSKWHTNHGFQAKTKVNGRWKTVSREKDPQISLEIANAFTPPDGLQEPHRRVLHDRYVPQRVSSQSDPLSLSRAHPSKHREGHVEKDSSRYRLGTNDCETAPCFTVSGRKMDSTASRRSLAIPRHLPPLTRTADRQHRPMNERSLQHPEQMTPPFIQGTSDSTQLRGMVCLSADSVISRRHKVRPIAFRKNLSADILGRKIPCEPDLRQLDDIFQVRSFSNVK